MRLAVLGLERADQGLLPADAVAAGGVARDVGIVEVAAVARRLRQIPHLEELLLFVVDHVAKDLRPPAFPRLVRLEDRIVGVLAALMLREPDPLRVADQDPVDEQLRRRADVERRHTRLERLQQFRFGRNRGGRRVGEFVGQFGNKLDEDVRCECAELCPGGVLFEVVGEENPEGGTRIGRLESKRQKERCGNQSPVSHGLTPQLANTARHSNPHRICPRQDRRHDTVKCTRLCRI